MVRSAAASEPRARLGEGESAYLLARHQRGYELALLPFGAEHGDVLGAERQVSAEYRRGGGAAAGYLLDRYHHLASRSAAAAVLLVYAEAEYAELSQPPDVVVRELAALVVVGGAGSEFGIGELSRTALLSISSSSLSSNSVMSQAPERLSLVCVLPLSSRAVPYAVNYIKRRDAKGYVGGEVARTP